MNDGMRGENHRSLRNLGVVAGLLPLSWRASGAVPMDAGMGVLEPTAVLTPAGVAVSRNGVVSLHSFDLRHEVWRHSLPSAPRLIACAGRLVAGQGDGVIREFDSRTGELCQKIETGRRGVLVAVTSDGYVARTPPALTAFDRAGRVLWSREDIQDVVGETPEGLLVCASKSDAAVVCVQGATGVERWRFRVDGTPGAVLHDYGVTSRGVVIVVREVGVFRLDAVSGEVLGRGQPPYLGCTLVTEGQLYFANSRELIAFDPIEMRETWRMSYRDEPRGFPNGLVVAENAVLWTSMTGYVTAVGLPGTAEAGARWDAFVGDRGFVPAGVDPFVHDRHLYVTLAGGDMAVLGFVATPAAIPVRPQRAAKTTQHERASVPAADVARRQLGERLTRWQGSYGQLEAVSVVARVLAGTRAEWSDTALEGALRIMHHEGTLTIREREGLLDKLVTEGRQEDVDAVLRYAQSAPAAALGGFLRFTKAGLDGRT